MIDADYSIDNFVKKLYQRTKPSLSFKAKTKEEFLSWQRALKGKIKELLREWPKPADLKPDLYSREEKEKYTREKWIIQSEKDCYVPLYLLIPKGIKKKAPAILCCHGHNDFAKGLSQNKLNHLPEVILERDKERRVSRSRATQMMSDAVAAPKIMSPG